MIKTTILETITSEEFHELANDVKATKKEIQSLIQNFQPKRQEEYITRQELAKLLQVSLVTIHHWSKQGIIKPYRLGKLIRFKRSEVEEALITINN